VTGRRTRLRESRVVPRKSEEGVLLSPHRKGKMSTNRAEKVSLRDARFLVEGRIKKQKKRRGEKKLENERTSSRRKVPRDFSLVKGKPNNLRRGEIEWGESPPT